MLNLAVRYIWFYRTDKARDERETKIVELLTKVTALQAAHSEERVSIAERKMETSSSGNACQKSDAVRKVAEAKVRRLSNLVLKTLDEESGSN